LSEKEESVEESVDVDAEMEGLTEQERVALKEEPEPKTNEEVNTDEEKQTPEASAAQTPKPLLNAVDTENTEEQLKSIYDQKKTLVTQFDDGDLTAAEYQSQLDRINKQERDIERQQFKSSIANEMAENQQRVHWESTVNTFLDAHPEYRGSEVKYQTLDAVVRKVAQEDENSGLTGKEILHKAHERILSEFGGLNPATQSNAKKTAQTIPPTLGGVPAAENADIGQNPKYRQLDNLMEKDPVAFERVLAGLSEDEQNAYLSAS
jgi:hypothetical protein